MSGRKSAKVPADRLAATRVLLAAWMTDQSTVAKRTIDPDDLVGYVVTPHDEWLVFSSPSRSNQSYLVSETTVYSFAPSQETFDTALANARALADEQNPRTP